MSLHDIGIIGTGRFGSYMAGQLRQVGYTVQTVDRTDPADGRQAALERVCAAPLVIYAVPMRALEGALLETRALLNPDTIVLDVSSVKVMPCALLVRHLPGIAKCSAHPLFGPQSAPVRCAGQRIALCTLPTIGDTPAAPHHIARVRTLFERLGLHVVECTPEEHDRQIAQSQFITHFIGRGAVQAGIARVAVSTRTHDALMDIVDVTSGDSLEMFEDMAALNPMAASVRTQFLDALHAIDRHLTAHEQATHEQATAPDRGPAPPAPARDPR